MEFDKGPLPVSDIYRERVAEVLRGSRVAVSGYFDESGVFDVVRLEEKTDLFNTTPMWALNLLRFTSDQDRVRATRDGFLRVYPERMSGLRGDRIKPVHTIDPGNVRFVDSFTSSFRVRKSGWLVEECETWRHQMMIRELTLDGLERILIEAEAGNKPPFFDYKTYIKVEPESVGKAVRVIRFGTLDAVVIDVPNRQLVNRSIEDILSQRRWGVNPSLVVPVST